MKSILIKQPGHFEIIDRAIPHPADDELLIRVTFVSLCNQHDWKVNKGLYRDQAYLEYGVPGFPGHEGVGVVEAVGSDVVHFKIGDVVVMSGLGGPPLYSEYVTRKSALVARAPADAAMEPLAMSELIACVHRACHKVPDLKGKSVLISGCGPGGLAAIQICRAYGAGTIAAVDVQVDRLQLALTLGADAAVDANEDAAVEALSRQGVEIVIECTGNHKAMQRVFRIARQAVVIFSYSEGDLRIPLWPLFDYELTIYNSKWLTNEDLQSVVDLITAGKIRTAPMISATADFAHYPDLVEKIGRGEIIKAVMRVSR